MLRKLMKYEFRATARVMLPLYLVTVLLALGTRGVVAWARLIPDDGLTVGPSILAFLGGLVAVGFLLALVATFVVAVVLSIVRFRNNLLTDEGYVMFTLPVSTHSLVLSKLLVSLVWFLGAIVIDVAGLLFLSADVSLFQALGTTIREGIQEINAYYLGNGILFVVELLLLFLVGCAVTCLTFYAPLAIGHSFARHKMLLSVAFFFAVAVAMEIISGVALIAGLPALDSLFFWGRMNLGTEVAIHGFLWGMIGYTAVFAVVLYAITIRMLHRHLNLD